MRIVVLLLVVALIVGAGVAAAQDSPILTVWEQISERLVRVEGWMDRLIVPGSDNCQLYTWQGSAWLDIHIVCQTKEKA